MPIVKLPGISAQKPKFSDHRRRTWDSIVVILPDGSRTDGWLDTTWGEWVYFQVEQNWRKVSVDMINDLIELDLRTSKTI